MKDDYKYDILVRFYCEKCGNSNMAFFDEYYDENDNHKVKCLSCGLKRLTGI